MLREQWNHASPAQRQQMVEHAREQRLQHAGPPPGRPGPPPGRPGPHPGPPHR
jgi:hypothetical protein